MWTASVDTFQQASWKTCADHNPVWTPQSQRCQVPHPHPGASVDPRQGRRGALPGAWGEGSFSRKEACSHSVPKLRPLAPMGRGGGPSKEKSQGGKQQKAEIHPGLWPAATKDCPAAESRASAWPRGPRASTPDRMLGTQALRLSSLGPLRPAPGQLASLWEAWFPPPVRWK